MQVFAIWHQAVHRLFQGENSTARPLKPCPPIMTPKIPLNRGQNWKAGCGNATANWTLVVGEISPGFAPLLNQSLLQQMFPNVCSLINKLKLSQIKHLFIQIIYKVLQLSIQIAGQIRTF